MRAVHALFPKIGSWYFCALDTLAQQWKQLKYYTPNLLLGSDFWIALRRFADLLGFYVFEK